MGDPKPIRDPQREPQFSSEEEKERFIQRWFDDIDLRASEMGAPPELVKALKKSIRGEDE